MAVGRQATLSTEFDNYEEPKKPLAEAIGPAGQALAKLDALEAIMQAWAGYWKSCPGADGADALTVVESALPLIAEGTLQLHRGFSLLHMKLGDVDATHNLMALFDAKDEEDEEDEEE